MWWLDARTTTDDKTLDNRRVPEQASAGLAGLSEHPASRKTLRFPLASSESRIRNRDYAPLRVVRPKSTEAASKASAEFDAQSELAALQKQHARQLETLQQLAQTKFKEAEQRFSSDRRRLRISINNLESWQARREAEFAIQLDEARKAHQVIEAKLVSFTYKRDNEFADLETIISTQRSQAADRELALRELETNLAKKQKILDCQISASAHDQHVFEFKLAEAAQRLGRHIDQHASEAALRAIQYEQREAEFKHRLEQARASEQAAKDRISFLNSQHHAAVCELRSQLAAQQQLSLERESKLRELEAKLADKALLETQVLQATHDQHLIEFKLASAETSRVHEVEQLRSEVRSDQQQQQQKEVELVAELERSRTQQRESAEKHTAEATNHRQELAKLQAAMATEQQKVLLREAALRDQEAKFIAHQAVMDGQIYQAPHDQHVNEFMRVDNERRLVENQRQLQATIAAHECQFQQRDAEFARRLEHAQLEQHRIATNLAGVISQRDIQLADLQENLSLERQNLAEREARIQTLETRLTEQQALICNQVFRATHEQHVVEFMRVDSVRRLAQKDHQRHQREAEFIGQLERAQVEQHSIVTKLSNIIAQRDRQLVDLQASLSQERQRLVENHNRIQGLESRLAQQQTLLNDQVFQAPHEQHVIEFLRSKAEQRLALVQQLMQTTIADRELKLEQREAELGKQLKRSQAQQQETQAKLEKVVSERDQHFSELNAELASQRQSALEHGTRLHELQGRLAEYRSILNHQVARAPHDQHIVEFRLAQAKKLARNNRGQLQAACDSHQQQLQQREAEFSKQLEQARAAQRDVASQLAKSIAQRDKELAELNENLSAQRRLVLEREASLRELQAIRKQPQRSGNSQPGQSSCTWQAPHDQHVIEFMLAQAEQRRVESVVQSRKKIADLEQQLEERELESSKRLAESWSVRRRTESELAETVSKYRQTVDGLQAKLETLQGLADGREMALRQLERNYRQLQENRSVPATTAQSEQPSQVAKLAAPAKVQSTWVEKTPASQQAIQQNLTDAQAVAKELRLCLSQEKTAREQAETKLKECFAAIEKIKRQADALEVRLQREAAGRRKAEAGLKRAAEVADSDTIAHVTELQIAAERQIERLTSELLATRNQGLGMQRRAMDAVKHSQLEIERLKKELACTRAPHL